MRSLANPQERLVFQGLGALDGEFQGRIGLRFVPSFGFGTDFAKSVFVQPRATISSEIASDRCSRGSEASLPSARARGVSRTGK